MIHQPYVDWIFLEPEDPNEALTASQTEELNRHLADCQVCSQLAAAWSVSEDILRQSPREAPLPGFTRRWQERVKLERQLNHRRQGYFLLTMSLALAVAVLVIMILMAIPLLSSPSVLVWYYTYELVQWFWMLISYQQTISSIIGAFNLAIPAPAWLFLLGGLVVLIVMWIAVFKHLTNPRRVTK